jgi:hypothetical protein
MPPIVAELGQPPQLSIRGAEVHLAPAIRECVLHEHDVQVSLDVLWIRAQREPPLAQAALLCDQLEVFTEHALFSFFGRSRAPGWDEKTKAAHDQAATFSLESLFAEYTSRHIEPAWLSHRASPTPVGGPFGRS